MSHQSERKEKNCLNCGTIVQGLYCHHCGQANVETKLSFWALSQHFIYDIFHFDGKFFETLRPLVFKPGFVAWEYVQGRRVKYLDPIRMYLFTSALFFLVFFSLHKVTSADTDINENYLTAHNRLEVLMHKTAEAAQNPTDTLLQKQVTALQDSANKVYLQPTDAIDSSIQVPYKGNVYYVRKSDFDEEKLKTFVPDNVISRGSLRFVNAMEKKYDGDFNRGLSEEINIFTHRLPYLLFMSLPFFAGILAMLYKKRKDLYYHDHAIFTLYHYIFTFILLLVYFLFGKLHQASGWGIFSYAEDITLLLGFLYLFASIKRFYGSGFKQTAGKFLLLNLLGFITLLLLFLIFLFYSIYQI